MKYEGGCHCGAVRFEISAPLPAEIERCNCSICNKSGYLHLILPKQQFSLTSGEDSLSTYTFGSHIAQHYFCKVCGIKPFYIPRSNPDGVDVNLNCLDEIPAGLNTVAFDGQNWEQNAHKLAHKTAGDPSDE